MVVFGLCLALASLALIPWSIWYLAVRSSDPGWWTVPALLAGGLLAIFFVRMKYESGSDFQVWGFPIPAAVFERGEHNRWLDYVGWLTPIAPVANFLIGLGLPLVALALLSVLRKKRQAQP